MTKRPDIENLIFNSTQFLIREGLQKGYFSKDLNRY
jgi:hypothetical protein